MHDITKLCTGKKDPFKVWDRQRVVIGIGLESSLLYSFRFYITANLQESTTFEFLL